MVTPDQHLAVTGATGFIGQALCTRLVSEGFRVSALVRNTARATALEHAGVALVQGSLDDGERLQALVKNCDLVIHCAGAVRGQSQQDFNHTNVRGTAHILDAIEQQTRPPKLILISSLAAREPELSWYAQSKYQAEELIKTRRVALDWAIVRPPPVYGPGDKEMLPIFQWMSRGIAPVPGDKDSRISLVHVEDVVSAIIAIARQTQLNGATYTLDDGKTNGYNWSEMAAEVAAVWQCKVRLFAIPTRVLNAVAATNLTLSKLLGYAPMLTPAKLRELRHPDWVVDNAAITQATGWLPKISFRQGLEELRDSVL